MFKKKYCLVARGFFPAFMNPDAAGQPAGAVQHGSIAYIAKAKNLDAAVRQILDIVRNHHGTPLIAYHIPGEHTLSDLKTYIAEGGVEPVTVWEDTTRLKMFDLLVDYTVAGESKNDQLKLKTYTLEDAISVARAIVSNKGGVPSAVQHVHGDNTPEKLMSVAQGKTGCVTRLVWFDEEEYLASLSTEELMQGLLLSEMLTPAEVLSHSLLFESIGPDAPGVFIPPASIDLDALS